MEDLKLSKSSKKNLDVDKRIVELVLRVLKKSIHDFGIPTDGGFRTPQEQNNLFHKKPKVTWLDGFKKVSYHQSGMAWDIFVYDEHGACWECKKKYHEIAQIFKDEFELMQEEDIFDEDESLEWGGDWIKWKDLPHFQIVVR